MTSHGLNVTSERFERLVSDWWHWCLGVFSVSSLRSLGLVSVSASYVSFTTLVLSKVAKTNKWQIFAAEMTVKHFTTVLAYSWLLCGFCFFFKCFFLKSALVMLVHILMFCTVLWCCNYCSLHYLFLNTKVPILGAAYMLTFQHCHSVTKLVSLHHSEKICSIWPVSSVALLLIDVYYQQTSKFSWWKYFLHIHSQRAEMWGSLQRLTSICPNWCHSVTQFFGHISKNAPSFDLYFGGCCCCCCYYYYYYYYRSVHLFV